MRKIPLLLLVLAACFFPLMLTAQTADESNEGSQLTWDSTNGFGRFTWWGRAGRTYFIQQSSDLLTGWAYVNLIEPGTDAVKEWGFTSDGSKFFLRLKYTDIPTSDPWNDDFDGDGVSNSAELAQGTDPLSWSDADNNGLPDDWELFYFGHTGVDPDFPASRGDGLTNLEAFQLGLNPIDFYNGQTPALAIVSGNGQTGSPGGLVPGALTVSVSGTAGPLYNAPVTFTVTAGGGTVQKSSSATPGTTITTRTGESGQAKAFFKLPNIQNNTSTITATAGTGTHTATVTFTETSDDGTGSHGSPFDSSDVVATLNSDGSMDVTWTNNTDPEDTEPVNIRYKNADGQWVVLATAPAGSTSIHIPPQQ